MKLVSVAYPLRSSSTTAHDDLRYSLRSIGRFLEANIQNVFIATARLPRWLQGRKVCHVKQDDRSPHRTLNTLAKALAVATHPDCADHVLWMNDDILLLGAYDPWPLHNRGALTDRSGSNEYHRAQRNTLRLLRDRGISPVSFATHRPMIFERARFVEIMGPLLKSGHPLLWLSVYYNLAGVESVPSSDVKVRTGAEFFAAVESRAVISTDDAMMRHADVRQWLASRFAEPSFWERMPVGA